MADNATVRMQATVLPDEIAKTLTSTTNLAPVDANDKWYYKLTGVTDTSGRLMSGYFINQNALAGSATPNAVADDDLVKFLYIKNTDLVESVYVVIEALDVTAGDFVIGDTYVIKTPNATDFTLIGAADSNVGTTFTATGVGADDGIATFAATATEPTAIHLAPNEALSLRIPSQEVSKIHAVSSTGTVECIVAALLDDVA